MAVSMNAGCHKPMLMDSSSAIILFKCSLIDPVADYYRIIMPESVFVELTHEIHAGSNEFKRYRKEGNIHIITDVSTADSSQFNIPLIIGLGAGERDTILLYYKRIGDMIMLDDRKGAAYCRKNNIPYINALLVPRILEMTGRIISGEKDRLMKRIIEFGRYSQKIIEYAYCCSNEKIARFL